MANQDGARATLGQDRVRPKDQTEMPKANFPSLPEIAGESISWPDTAGDLRRNLAQRAAGNSWRAYRAADGRRVPPCG